MESDLNIKEYEARNKICRRTHVPLAICDRVRYNIQAVFAMTIGSRAILLCEPCQDRKVAALSI